MKITGPTRAVLGMAAGVLAYAGPACGAGFQIMEQCAKCQGTAYGGVAATADDASTVFFNPAGMTRLPTGSIGGQAVVGLHYLLLDAEFEDKDSTNAIGGEPIGSRKDNGGENAVVPNFYYAQKLTERLSAGLGLNGFYGLLTEYDDGWIGRYNAIKSELITVNFNPAVAYRINEQLSIGAGFSAQYADAELTNALDFGTLAFLAGVPGVTPSNPAFDGFAKLTGDDWGWGWNAGILYALSKRTRFGISYRSQIDHTLEGDFKVKGNPQLAALNPQFGSRTVDAKADLNTPAVLNIGVYHELIESRLAIMAGASWTDWSEFKEIRIRFASDQPDAVQPEDWEDSWRLAVGMSYKPYSAKSPWTLRIGFQYDESPIPNGRITARIPENDRYWLTLGLGYECPSFAFDFAVTHIFLSDFDIEETEVGTGSLGGVPVGSTLDGKYKPSADVISAQVTWRF